MTYVATEKSLPNILFELSEQADFDFSFDAKIVSRKERFTVKAEGQSLKSVLKDLSYQANVSCSFSDRQVVLYKENQQPDKYDQLLRGKVRNLSSGENIVGVTVYERFLDIEAISDSNGLFELEIDIPSYILFLTFKKEGYRERTVKFRLYDDNYLTVQLEEMTANEVDSAQVLASREPTANLKREDISLPLVKSSLLIRSDSSKRQLYEIPIQDEYWVKVFIKKDVRNNISLDSGIYYSPVNLGLWPNLCTDGPRTPYAIHTGLNFNVLVGLSAGVRGLDLAGLASINRYNTDGLQLSGLVNLSRGAVRGCQIAGLVNHDRMKTDGLQLSGLYNISGLSLRGLQVTGLSNIVHGVTDGMQLSGIINVTTEEVIGMQLTGILNTGNSTVNGMQLSGVANTSRKKLTGMQLTGVFNQAEHTDGAQVAGLLNYSHKLSGFQLGLVNVVDSLDHGVSVGFFNFVKNGYRRHEVTMAETGALYYQFKSGSSAFYNIFAIGALFTERDSTDIFWSYGYGIGTMIKAQSRFWGNIELMAYSLNKNGWSNQLHMLNKLNANLGFRIKNRFAVFIGPSLNCYLAHKELDGMAPIVPNNPMYTDSSSELDINVWLGFNAGIQF